MLIFWGAFTRKDLRLHPYLLSLHRPPPEGDGPLVTFDRAFAALISFQQKGRFSFANVATFNLDLSATSASIATRYKLLSLPVPHVPENLTWSDVYPVWVNESDASCPRIPEPSYPDWLTSIDAIVAHVPCDEPNDSWAKDVRWLHHLLTITSFVIRANRTWLPVVLLSACHPPPNLFHCSRLVTREGDTWLYNLTTTDMLTRVQPLGSCAMAQPINSEMAATQRVAYATVLHSSDRYVCGAIEIQEESKRGLKEAGWTVKEIERIRNPHALNGTYNEWNYSKLRLWQQTEYTKLLFIDSDLLLLNSIDFLFSYPEISARGNDGTDFNSGAMVLEPSDCMFDLLMANLERVQSENGGDQGFLNNVFTWWHRVPDSVNILKPVWTSDPVKKQALVYMKSRWFSEDPSEIHAIHYLVDDPLVPVRLDLEIGDQRLQDAFCWNSNEPDGEIATFAEGLVRDTKLPPYFLPHITQAIQAQVAEFRSLHAQDLAAVLGGLDVCTATCIIRDQFLWDLNNPYADPEAYAAGLCSDLGITDADPQAQVWVAVTLREQLLELARQMLASKEPRSSKRPRRERGGNADPKATAAAAAPTPPVGTTTLAFMRRADGRISVRRPRKDWPAFEPQVELLQTPSGNPTGGSAARNAAANAADADDAAIPALVAGDFSADVATPGQVDAGAADMAGAVGFSADVDLDGDDDTGAGDDAGNYDGVGDDVADRDVGDEDKYLGDESDDLGGVGEDEVYLSSYLPKRGPRHHV
ncbi:unnamed protein product [Closterium sp. Yama58-4]|nr:unnamed protein product [Closterium sp. Yama58-4]